MADGSSAAANISGASAASPSNLSPIAPSPRSPHSRTTSAAGSAGQGGSASASPADPKEQPDGSAISALVTGKWQGREKEAQALSRSHSHLSAHTQSTSANAALNTSLAAPPDTISTAASDAASFTVVEVAQRSMDTASSCGGDNESFSACESSVRLAALSPSPTAGSHGKSLSTPPALTVIVDEENEKSEVEAREAEAGAAGNLGQRSSPKSASTNKAGKSRPSGSAGSRSPQLSPRSPHRKPAVSISGVSDTEAKGPRPASAISGSIPVVGKPSSPRAVPAKSGSGTNVASAKSPRSPRPTAATAGSAAGSAAALVSSAGSKSEKDASAAQKRASMLAIRAKISNTTTRTMLPASRSSTLANHSENSASATKPKSASRPTSPRSNNTTPTGASPGPKQAWLDAQDGERKLVTSSSAADMAMATPKKDSGDTKTAVDSTPSPGVAAAHASSTGRRRPSRLSMALIMTEPDASGELNFKRPTSARIPAPVLESDDGHLKTPSPSASPAPKSPRSPARTPSNNASPATHGRSVSANAIPTSPGAKSPRTPPAGAKTIRAPGQLPATETKTGSTPRGVGLTSAPASATKISSGIRPPSFRPRAATALSPRPSSAHPSREGGTTSAQAMALKTTGNDFKDSADHKRERDHVLKEIVSTEHTYVQQFGLLVNEYLVPIQAKELMPKEHRTTLGTVIGAAQAILTVHNRFLAELQTQQNPVEVFIDFVEYFKCYFGYVQNFPHISRDLTSDDMPKSLNKFLQQTQQRLGHQGISQLLILPVQRIPRYFLLLERLYKHMPELHEDMLLARTALEKIRVVAARVDECQKQSENTACLFQLQRQIKGQPTALRIMTPSRLFVASFVSCDVMSCVAQYGKLDTTSIKHPSKHSVRVTLFNDMLLLTDYKYQYLSHISLETLSVEASARLLLEVRTGIEGEKLEAVLLFESPLQRDEWKMKLHEAGRAYQDNLNQLFKRQKKPGLISSNSATNLLSAGGGAGGSTAGSASGAEEKVGSGSSIEQVNLYLRVRPLLGAEEKQCGRVCLQTEDNIAVLTLQDGDSKKKVEKVGVYDDIFDGNADQEAVFQKVGQEILGALFAGYNAAIMAYGNTGAGKTHTMFGNLSTVTSLSTDSLAALPTNTSGTETPEVPATAAIAPARSTSAGAVLEAHSSAPSQHSAAPSTDNVASDVGLIPRMLLALFEVLDTPGLYKQAEVKVSYVQVYNNELEDLQITPDESVGGAHGLRIKKSKEVHKVKGLEKTTVKSAAEAMRVVLEGNKRRAVRAHKMNDVSSRSHAILIVQMECQRQDEETPTKTYLHLVDLAGSENAKDTGATGDALVECRHINQSLTALGRVITTLVNNKEKCRNDPVPFRESKLTHLLADVLGGDFVCSIILNASPSPVFEQDTLTAKTMAFGAGVKKLSIKPKPQSTDSAVKHWLVGVWKSVARRI